MIALLRFPFFGGKRVVNDPVNRNLRKESMSVALRESTVPQHRAVCVFDRENRKVRQIIVEKVDMQKSYLL